MESFMVRAFEAEKLVIRKVAEQMQKRTKDKSFKDAKALQKIISEWLSFKASK